MEKLNFNSFQPLLGNEFRVRIGEDEYLKLELIESTEKNTDKTEGFSLIFSGSKDLILNQMTHQFSNDVLGEFEMFITPIQSKAIDSIHYQAIFNRLMN